MLPSFFVFNIFGFVNGVCIRTSSSATGLPAPASPPLLNAAPYVDKVLSSEPVFAAYVDNSLSEKTIIPFPISPKNRKDDPLCQQTIPREIQKPISLQYEPAPVFQNGIKGLTIPKSNLYETFRVKKNAVKYTASPRSLQPEKKFFIRRAKRLPKYALQLPQNRPISVHATRDSGRLPILADRDTHRTVNAAGNIYSLIL